jgi:c-di-GMP-binding flagellar brake protein YcgR
MDAPPVERRSSRRVRVPPGAVAVTMPMSATVQVLDMSETGMLLAAAQPVEVGRRGRLRVRIGHELVSVEVEVRRIESGRPGSGAYRLGAEYVDLDDSTRRRIAGFLRAD